MNVAGWDLGGAHVKAAVIDSRSRLVGALQLPCTLWRGVEHLERAVREALCILECEAASPAHAVTMTGELSDGFLNRSEGVRKILAAISPLLPAPLVYSRSGSMLTVDEALRCPLSVASENWHALARFVALNVREALVVDIGSTTTDITPVVNGEVAAHGCDDYSRLSNEELVYTGIVRTPIMSLAMRARFRGRDVNVMAEHFATTADVYRLTGELESEDQSETADGREKTVEASARRLARTIGCDLEDAELAEWRDLAAYFSDVQLRRIVAACHHSVSQARLSENAAIVGAGSGAFLARKVAARLDRAYFPFTALADAGDASPLSQCAPAFAVAWLRQRFEQPL